MRRLPARQRRLRLRHEAARAQLRVARGASAADVDRRVGHQEGVDGRQVLLQNRDVVAERRARDHRRLPRAVLLEEGHDELRRARERRRCHDAASRLGREVRCQAAKDHRAAVHLVEVGVGEENRDFEEVAFIVARAPDPREPLRALLEPREAFRDLRPRQEFLCHLPHCDLAVRRHESGERVVPLKFSGSALEHVARLLDGVRIDGRARFRRRIAATSHGGAD